jgi:outer membrane protein TolC
MSRFSMCACVLWGMVCAVGVSYAPAHETNGTMSLTQCVAYAEANSRELKERLLALDRQILSTYISRGQYRTSLVMSGYWRDASEDGGSSVELTRGIPWGMDVGASYRNRFEDDGEDTATLALTLSKVVLGGGSRAESMLEIDNNLLEELVQGNLVHRKRRELAYRVRSAYYNVIRSRQTLIVRERRLERSERNLEVTREREDPLDIANAELEVPDAEANVLRAEREIASALDALKLILGMEVSADVDVGDEVRFAPQAIDLATDLAYCYAHHEELLNAELDRHQLVNTLDVQRKRTWPRVTVGASYQERTESGSGSADSEEEVAATAALAWELGSRTEQAKTQRGEVDMISLETQNLTLHESRTARVRDLARRLEETLQSVHHRERSLEVSGRRVKLYEDRWENGEIDILEFQRSQTNYEDSRIDLINLKTTYMEQLAEYTYEVGR